MGDTIKRFQILLQSPISMRARVLLFLAVLSIPFVFQSPLWTMSFRSNQYPDPLKMSIYINHLEGQKTDRRDDLREINALNHYIGMRPLMESDFAEFLWLPFAMGFFGLITLRAVVFGTFRDLVDIAVLFTYFGLFSAWTFYNRLYQYGHNLDPEAAINVEPFTPPFFGSVQIANFWVESYPGGGSLVMALFGGLFVAAIVLAYLDARGNQREASAH